MRIFGGIFRFITGIFSFKVIVYLVALWVVWYTMGTVWTIAIAYGLAVLFLLKWGPQDDKSFMAHLTFLPTRGSPYALVAPLAIALFFPFAIIGALGAGGLMEEMAGSDRK